MNKVDRIYVAGHRGLVGSALCRRLQEKGYTNLLTRTHEELDLTNSIAVKHFLEEEKPDCIFLAAAKVGGIHANNTQPADFIYTNLSIEINIVEAAHQTGIDRLLLLGSSCIYPRMAEQPMKEEALLSGPLESTNEPYAIAKIAGIKLCESYNRQYGTHYRSVMPTNLYGPNDNFHTENSHVVPALIRKFHEAKTAKVPKVIVWGSGKPKREFLYVDDMADACIHIMNLDDGLYSRHTSPMLSHINVGTGSDISIDDLSQVVADVTGYEGEIVFDISKPDGPPRKLLDVTKARKLGWVPSTQLTKGLELTYRWFLEHQHNFRQ